MARSYRHSQLRRALNALIRLALRVPLPLPLGSTYLLTTRGRRSGRPVSTPVTIVRRNGQRWLVAPYGTTHWVRNARGAGRVTLGRGGRAEELAVAEVPPDVAAPVLREYVRRVRVVRPYVDAGTDAPLEAFAAVAARHPVFRLETPSAGGGSAGGGSAAAGRVDTLAAGARDHGAATGWFEDVYRDAAGTGDVPWASSSPHPSLVAWLEEQAVKGDGRRALTVGAGLGDDAEALARRGFDVTAFDIAPSAVSWARRRFPDSPVDYRVADLLAPPPEWSGAFDLVVEVYTLQSLPAAIRATAAARMAELLAPGGTLLVVAVGRAKDEDPGERPPWPLAAAEVRQLFAGLDEVRLEEEQASGQRPGRRLRAEFRRRAA